MKKDTDLIWEAYLYEVHNFENLQEAGRFANVAAGLGLGTAAMFGGMEDAKGAEPFPQDFTKSSSKITQSVKRIDQLKMKSPAMKRLVDELLSGPNKVEAERFLNNLSLADERSITPLSKSDHHIDLAVQIANTIMRSQSKGGKVFGSSVQKKDGGISSDGGLKRPSQAKEIPEP